MTRRVDHVPRTRSAALQQATERITQPAQPPSSPTPPPDLRGIPTIRNGTGAIRGTTPHHHT